MKNFGLQSIGRFDWDFEFFSPDKCGKSKIVGEVETKLRYGGGEVCHVSTNHTIFWRSKALDPRDDELGIRIEV